MQDASLLDSLGVGNLYREGGPLATIELRGGGGGEGATAFRQSSLGDDPAEQMR